MSTMDDPVGYVLARTSPRRTARAQPGPVPNDPRLIEYGENAPAHTAEHTVEFLRGNSLADVLDSTAVPVPTPPAA
ncbi:hypothetical protein ABT093_25710 [Kitasatospora sp. NPDC002551]|uniref:hypothetical protein n=1 Tax=Kitasatospora sp. NPDC002551 TaxID=3154539 RepID=UPI003322F879